MLRNCPTLLHVKSFLASPRSYLNARRQFFAMGSQVQRWSDLSNFDAAWDERTSMMAVMVPPHASVLEFGSGREQLARFLPEGCTYQPCDLVARSPHTLVWNLNDGFPTLEQRYDVIIFSGVIEYVHDLDRLFANVRAHCSRCIVSYATTDALDCVSTRLANGWVHHLSNDALVAIFKKHGFSILKTAPWQQQTIYHLV